MYDKLAYIYDNLINEDVDYDKMVNWLDIKIKEKNISANSLLEIGCGTGNVSIPLSKLGYNVTGMDISDEMLSVADEKSFAEGSSVRWMKGDVCNFANTEKYHAAVSCLDTINYILGEEDLDNAFKNIYNSLEKGGVFIFDINTKYRLKDVYGNHSFNYVSDDLCYIWNCFYDSENDISEFEIDFFVKAEGTNNYERFDEVHVQKAYEIEKIKYMLLNAGFDSVDAYDFLSETLPTSRSEKVGMVAFCN
ncbi:class I SAM-dependent DNA methyltransferase [Alkalibacter saccharofermentans]|uniref:Ubiquinone/menaquinone biosynthesis C-methylase UbiE n=1 Tax=Alkalibacter saccharofermentans DSM 14828 TaxID=1120975 RepID=A0A1M4XPF8_9FIRM|nr:class I SAM-dependent methyltransferase [Alkalibacter saccharofermentans]SHE95256.1 Ubiquinone/menaquinone biosynthesis C-methylase UbiE [Alkalibacter saccharofermentans DSM 14828]